MASTSARGHGLHDHGASGEQRSRTRQYLQGRHSRAQRGREGGILSVDGMLDPGIGGVGVADLRDVGRLEVERSQREDERAVVAVDVDDARRQPAAFALDDLRTRARQVATDSCDPPSSQQHLRVSSRAPAPSRTVTPTINVSAARLRADTCSDTDRRRSRALLSTQRRRPSRPAPGPRRQGRGAANGSCSSSYCVPATNLSLPSTTVRRTAISVSFCGSTRSGSASSTTRSAM